MAEIGRRFVRKARAELDAALTAALVDADDKAARAFAAGDAKGALATLTDHAVAAGAAATARWTALWQERSSPLSTDMSVTRP